MLDTPKPNNKTIVKVLIVVILLQLILIGVFKWLI